MFAASNNKKYDALLSIAFQPLFSPLLKNNGIDFNVIDAPEHTYLSISVSQLPASGNGLYTAIAIYKEEIIAIFRGELLTDLQVKLRADKKKDQYFIQMLDGSIMDSMKTKCFAKYANDTKGSTNSIFSNNAKIALDEDDNVCLIATRNIKSNEEIFCDYGKKYWINQNLH
jgi:hypothetical protein